MKSKAIQIAAAAIPALIAGVLLGYLARPSASGGSGETAPASKPSRRAAVSAESRNADADLNRLRARIRELERRLADAATSARQEDAPPETTSARNEERPFRHGPPTAAEMRERMEKIKRDDPERYTQMTNNMARWRARRQERLRNQFGLLANADTAHMTKEQKAAHDKYQELLMRQEELRELANPENENTTDAQRDAAFDEMRAIGREIHMLQNAERDTLLTQTANALGLTGEDAAEVVSAIKAVYEATGGGERHGPPHGRRGR